MLIFWLVLILIISFVWALISLKREKNKHREVEKAKTEIAKGRVVYYSSSSEESSKS